MTPGAILRGVEAGTIPSDAPAYATAMVDARLLREERAALVDRLALVIEMAAVTSLERSAIRRAIRARLLEIEEELA